MNIIMLGAQGTGKGTVAGLISGEIGIPQISTGDIFRKNISEQTPLGIEADKYISKGNLVPDEITVPMVKDRLTWEDAKNGAILDGFPRNLDQAHSLDTILEELGAKVYVIGNQPNGVNINDCEIAFLSLVFAYYNINKVYKKDIFILDVL